MDKRRYTPSLHAEWHDVWWGKDHYDYYWRYDGGVSDVYLTLYAGVQVNVAGGIWLGGGYGLERGAYFTIEYTL